MQLARMIYVGTTWFKMWADQGKLYWQSAALAVKQQEGPTVAPASHAPAGKEVAPIKHAVTLLTC
jgi:hypothetical protein